MPPTCTTPRTVEEIFKDYCSRRTGIIRALTQEVNEFYSLCDPEKGNLCLYGHPNSTWEVALPAEEVPPELPEPALGINFARDGMNRRDWLSLVAVHSDSWLLSVAFYLGAPFNGNERLPSGGLGIKGNICLGYWCNIRTRKRLFSMINDLPTVLEAITDRKLSRDKCDSGSKSKQSTKRLSDVESKINITHADEGYEDDEDEPSESLCGTCGGNYNSSEFWIGCDVCERWFHGKCVKITPAKAESIKQYKCPSCSSKRGRQ